MNFLEALQAEVARCCAAAHYYCPRHLFSLGRGYLQMSFPFAISQQIAR
jgi:hypothetical protein